VTERNPYKNFGIADRRQLAEDSGLAFLTKLLDATYPAAPFTEVSEIWPVEVTRGRVVFEGVPSHHFYNPMGTVHGGWLSTLLDSAMGCAVHSLLEPGQVYTTVEMKVNFVRPALERTGKLKCEGQIVHLGARMATSQGRIVDGDGKLIAHGSETCMILKA
jgi:uncharacterized protein (TIGR00369 family)